MSEMCGSRCLPLCTGQKSRCNAPVHVADPRLPSLDQSANPGRSQSSPRSTALLACQRLPYNFRILRLPWHRDRPKSDPEFQSACFPWLIDIMDHVGHAAPASMLLHLFINIRTVAAAQPAVCPVAFLSLPALTHVGFL